VRARVSCALAKARYSGGCLPLLERLVLSAQDARGWHRRRTSNM
jgi:hypothetical protein